MEVPWEILGVGGIGSAVGRRAAAFGKRCLRHRYRQKFWRTGSKREKWGLDGLMNFFRCRIGLWGRFHTRQKQIIC
ncbi:MAG: hypothetical protein CM1200mP3_02120 [Chloroflexota bacterium]|nr:MAG: hypothetical protein CM1200mP3_02120 [Chloroflexota bacterium]